MFVKVTLLHRDAPRYIYIFIFVVAVISSEAPSLNTRVIQAHAGNYADEGADGVKTNSMGGVDNCAAGITNSLAAFLIAAGEYSYYHCASGWQSNAAWPAVEDAWLAWRDVSLSPSSLCPLIPLGAFIFNILCLELLAPRHRKGGAVIYYVVLPSCI